MTAYHFAYLTLAILLAAFIPAMFAAEKERRFSKWYVYGVFLLPFAFVHSLILKRPEHRINIYIHDKNAPSRRGKKTYRVIPAEKKNIVISPRHIYIVFFSKLVFGSFVALSVFAAFRTLVHGTDSLKTACMIFAILFSVMLSIVELCRFSRFPIIADEITKRALIIVWMSVICSLPLYLVKNYIFDNTLSSKYADFTMFVCTVASLAIFLAMLLRKQNIYYAFFNRFSDYCILSMCAYAIFAAITLIWMSISDISRFIYAVAMPVQIFNLDYFSGVEVIQKISYIYSSALVHLFVELMILFSGLLCRNFKRKELEYRIEYRSKAFRMSRKRILRRHIPNMESARVKPLLKV